MIGMDDDFGGPDPVAERENVIPFPNMRPNTKLGALWAEEVARANKDRRRKLQLVSPLGALQELERKQKLPTMPWPANWPELAKRARLYAGECCGIVGPSGGGKTSFALQVAIACAGDGIPVLWLPKELDAPELDIRISANMVGRHTAVLRDEWSIKQFSHALASVDDLWHYVDNVRDTDDQIDVCRQAIAIAKRVYRRAPVLAIDYMGKFARGAKDPRLAIGDAAEAFREMALETDTFVLMLNQPSRANNDTLTGRKDLESATDAIAVAGESSEIEFACSVMLGLNVFKQDDAHELDAHVLVSKARGTGREGRQGFRFSKPGGVWSELDYLPATPGEVAAENKRQVSGAKKAKTEPPTKATTRAEVNVDRAKSAEDERESRITNALRAAGPHGLSTAELRKVPGTGRAQSMQRSLQSLERKGVVEKLIGTKRWRIP